MHKREQAGNRRLSLLCGLGLALSPLLSFADTSQSGTLESTQQQLEQVSQQLSDSKQQQAELQQAYSAKQQQLKQLELHIGQLKASQHRSQQSLKQLEQELQTLEARQHQQARELKQQQQQLAAQLRAAYQRGDTGTIGVLLGEQQASQTERLLGYWQAVNQARQQAIHQLKQKQTELKHTERQIAQRQQQQVQLVQKQQQSQSELHTQRRAQEALLAQIAAQRQSSAQKLAALEASQFALNRQLSDAIEAQATRQATSAAPQALVGLSNLTQKLAWPVKGQIRHRFGSSRLEQAPWSGVMLSAPEGSQVRSIHHGEVIFADWLRGYGLVIVVDHGEDYLSLYAHNESLLYGVGQRVEAGEPIALVGNSGNAGDDKSQNQPGLYFEVRHKGRAVDPAKWCRHG